jgi:hypothetical protein
MKLSTELQQIHDSGDCGRAVEGLAEKAILLERGIDQGIDFLVAARAGHETTERERDQLKLQCISLCEELAEMKENSEEQADALHEIHKEDVKMMKEMPSYHILRPGIRITMRDEMNDADLGWIATRCEFIGVNVQAHQVGIFRRKLMQGECLRTNPNQVGKVRCSDE